MVKEPIIESVKVYLSALKNADINVEFAVIFGSQASGKTHKWSDIDLLIVSPIFDNLTDREKVNQLWRIAAQVDTRIEPIPCGSKQWLEDDVSAIIEIARREGHILTAA